MKEISSILLFCVVLVSASGDPAKWDCPPDPNLTVGYDLETDRGYVDYVAACFIASIYVTGDFDQRIISMSPEAIIREAASKNRRDGLGFDFDHLRWAGQSDLIQVDCDETVSDGLTVQVNAGRCIVFSSNFIGGHGLEANYMTWIFEIRISESGPFSTVRIATTIPHDSKVVLRTISWRDQEFVSTFKF
jgi:hypothetical protein